MRNLKKQERGETTMASNRLPTNGGLLIDLVQKMIVGIHDIGPSVPVTMVTRAEMQAALDPFTAANTAYNTARSDRQTASDAYQAATANIYTWLLAARLALVPKLGSRWSTIWAQAGFINRSTRIPAKIADRSALIVALKTFFTANPTYQSPNTDVTPEKATELITASDTAQAELTEKEMVLNDAGTAWTATYDPLVEACTTLIKNLEGKLGPLDPRWLGFGLQMPGSISTPPKVTGLAANLDEAGQLIVSWDWPPNATRVRVRGFAVGIENEYRLLASSTEPLASVAPPLSGQTLQLAAQGVNENLQGVLSDPIQFTMPLVSVTAPETKPDAEARQAIADAAAAAPTPAIANGQPNASHSLARV
jgi:hypothetical protein